MPEATRIAPDDRLLRIDQVREMVPKDKATIYRWIAKGDFPRGYRIGPGSVAWLRSEILEWMNNHTRR